MIYEREMDNKEGMLTEHIRSLGFRYIRERGTLPRVTSGRLGCICMFLFRQQYIVCTYRNYCSHPAELSRDHVQITSSIDLSLSLSLRINFFASVTHDTYVHGFLIVGFETQG